MRLAILALAAALPAVAAAPESGSTAPITLSAKDALHRVALPFDAYRDARLDLADVRVLDGKGEPVPIAWAGDPEAMRQETARLELPIFPIQRVPPAGELPSSDIRIKTADGTLVEVRKSEGMVLE